jgi:hypothetical protein
MKKTKTYTDADWEKLKREYCEVWTETWEDMIKSINNEVREKALNAGYVGPFQEWSLEEGRKQLILFIYTNSGWSPNHIADLTWTNLEFTRSVIFSFNRKNPELVSKLAAKNLYSW